MRWHTPETMIATRGLLRSGQTILVETVMLIVGVEEFQLVVLTHDQVLKFAAVLDDIVDVFDRYG